MGFINIFVASSVYASVERSQLKLKKQESEESITYPLEDINSVLFDNSHSVISIKTLVKLAENNIITYFCDDKHLPQVYLLSYNAFYRNLNVYKKQVEVKRPTLKNLWKNIIKSKISNQMAVLDILGITHTLDEYIDRVQSDDSTNVEGVVAGKYFKLLFGNDFTRRDESIYLNSALNYGYAIVRGNIARSVVAHGLQSYLGIHHINELNNFNLVDDLIEPFRAVVDLYVCEHNKGFVDGLDSKAKMTLLSVLNVDVLLDGQRVALSHAIDVVVSSYVQCISTNTFDILLPNVIEIGMHEYE